MGRPPGRPLQFVMSHPGGSCSPPPGRPVSRAPGRCPATAERGGAGGTSGEQVGGMLICPSTIAHIRWPGPGALLMEQSLRWLAAPRLPCWPTTLSPGPPARPPLLPARRACPPCPPLFNALLPPSLCCQLPRHHVRRRLTAIMPSADAHPAACIYLRQGLCQHLVAVLGQHVACNVVLAPGKLGCFGLQ